MTARAPTAEVEDFLGDLERALQERRRRLSAEAVRRVLERAGGDKLSRLMEAAQAADRRPAIVEVLAAALRAPGVRRGVYVLDEEQNIKYLGRLDEALYRALVQVTGAG